MEILHPLYQLRLKDKEELPEEYYRDLILNIIPKNITIDTSKEIVFANKYDDMIFYNTFKWYELDYKLNDIYIYSKVTDTKNITLKKINEKEYHIVNDGDIKITKKDLIPLGLEGLIEFKKLKNIDFFIQKNPVTIIEKKILDVFLSKSKIKKEVNYPENSNPNNLIIKSENLQALNTLLDDYRGKVKLIYIDPPYNTGNDSFKYNDNFNHSTWLTFMKNRLEIAKELLRDDGVIFVQCDDNEQAYLKVLMDEVFGREKFLSLLPRITKKAGKSTDLIAKNNDLILIYFKKKVLLNKESVDMNNYTLKDDYFEERGGYKLSQTLDYNSLQYNKTMDYEIKINNKIFYPGGKELFEERKNGKFNKIDWVWRWGKDKLKFGLDNGFIEIKNNRIYTKTYSNATISKKNGEYFIEIIKRTKNISSLDFVLNNAYSNDNSVKHIAKLFGNKNIFGYTKPESLIKKIIEISTQPGDIVLDYHLGSGTTAAVAHKMGRQYIGIEQMDYIEDIAVERMKKVIEGEQGGISKAVEWKGGGEFKHIELETFEEKLKKLT